jgi:predicted nucleotidyltransferase component of viral defense system
MDSNASTAERIDEFARLVHGLRAAGIPFLLVGGLSLSAHHYERTTHDIDFYGLQKRYAEFDAVMRELGYERLHEPTELYVRYAQKGRDIVDFIFANESTFAQMEASSREATVLGASVRVPCLEHLLAMKLFALEQSKRLKDLGDIAELLRANDMDVNGPEFEELCLKFSSERWLKFFRECS